MFSRRNVLLSLAAIPAWLCGRPQQTSKPTEARQPCNDLLNFYDPRDLPITAQELAYFELVALQVNYPEDWQATSYVGSVELKDRFRAFYCVTTNEQLRGLWAGRLERAMYPLGLRVFDVGQAGQIPGRYKGCSNVTLVICDSDDFERLYSGCYADLIAKHPDKFQRAHGAKGELAVA